MRAGPYPWPEGTPWTGPFKTMSESAPPADELVDEHPEAEAELDA